MQTMVAFWRHARLLGMMLALAALMVSPATAQDQNIAPSTAAPPATAQNTTTPSTTVIIRPPPQGIQRIPLAPSTAELLRMDRPFQAVIVADPDIADVTSEGDQNFIVTAKKKEGATNVIVLDADRKPIFYGLIVVASAPNPFAIPPPGKGERVTVHMGGPGKDPEKERGILQKFWVYRCPPQGQLCELITEPEPLPTSVSVVNGTSTVNSTSTTTVQPAGAGAGNTSEGATTSTTTTTTRP